MTIFQHEVPQGAGAPNVTVIRSSGTPTEANASAMDTMTPARTTTFNPSGLFLGHGLGGTGGPSGTAIAGQSSPRRRSCRAYANSTTSGLRVGPPYRGNARPNPTPPGARTGGGSH